MKTTLILGLLVGLSAGDKKWLDEAAQAGMTEVKLSQIAIKTSANGEVKQFAQTMIDEHGIMHDQLAGLAERKSVVLPTEVSSEQKKIVNELTKLNGEKFDLEYAKVMVDEHKKAVKHFEKASKSEDADIKSWASDSLPDLKKHLENAQTLEKSVKASAKKAAQR